MTFSQVIEISGHYCMYEKLGCVEKARGFKFYGMQILLLQVCRIFFLTMNTKSTLGDLFYHLFCLI